MRRLRSHRAPRPVRTRHSYLLELPAPAQVRHRSPSPKHPPHRDLPREHWRRSRQVPVQPVRSATRQQEVTTLLWTDQATPDEVCGRGLSDRKCAQSRQRPHTPKSQSEHRSHIAACKGPEPASVVPLPENAKGLRLRSQFEHPERSRPEGPPEPLVR